MAVDRMSKVELSIGISGKDRPHRLRSNLRPNIAMHT